MYVLPAFARSISDVARRYLPPGTAFWVHAYSMHRDPRNFSRPDEFWPERWLLAAASTTANAASQSQAEAARIAEGPAPEGFRHNLDAFIPFSHGPMNCVGKRLAHAEIRAVVCAVLHRFRVRAAESCPAKGGEKGEKREVDDDEGVLDLAAYERGFLDFFVTVRPPVRVMLEARPVSRQEGGA